jgi:DNA-binding response OmpR family regulator
MRILIADDDPVSLRLLSAALDDLRHEVTLARDGEEAWALYQQADFPLVITDWMMPRMSGIELCKTIREQERDRYCYVVMVTTLSDHEKTLEGFEAGVDDYLVKPFNAEQLRTRIEVAERVRRGMEAKIEMTMRRTVEICQETDGEKSRALLESVKTLGAFYHKQRAYTKARAFLRRQISLAESNAGAPEEVVRLRAELDSLRGLEDATV